MLYKIGNDPHRVEIQTRTEVPYKSTIMLDVGENVFEIVSSSLAERLEIKFWLDGYMSFANSDVGNVVALGEYFQMLPFQMHQRYHNLLQPIPAQNLAVLNAAPAPPTATPVAILPQQDIRPTRLFDDVRFTYKSERISPTTHRITFTSSHTLYISNVVFIDNIFDVVNLGWLNPNDDNNIIDRLLVPIIPPEPPPPPPPPPNPPQISTQYLLFHLASDVLTIAGAEG
jgi:hypothetical protein